MRDLTRSPEVLNRKRTFAQNYLVPAQATGYSSGKFDPAAGREGCSVSETDGSDRMANVIMKDLNIPLEFSSGF